LDLGNEFLNFSSESLAIGFHSWLISAFLGVGKGADLFSGVLLDVKLEVPLGDDGSSGGDGLNGNGSLLGELQFLEFVSFLNGLDGADLGGRDVSDGLLILNSLRGGLLFTDGSLLLLDLGDLLVVFLGSLELVGGLFLKSRGFPELSGGGNEGLVEEFSLSIAEAGFFTIWGWISSIKG